MDSRIVSICCKFLLGCGKSIKKNNGLRGAVVTRCVFVFEHLIYSSAKSKYRPIGISLSTDFLDFFTGSDDLVVDNTETPTRITN